MHRQETVECLKKFNARRKLKVCLYSPTSSSSAHCQASYLHFLLCSCNVYDPQIQLGSIKYKMCLAEMAYMLPLLTEVIGTGSKNLDPELSYMHTFPSAVIYRWHFVWIQQLSHWSMPLLPCCFWPVLAWLTYQHMGKLEAETQVAAGECWIIQPTCHQHEPVVSGFAHLERDGKVRHSVT